MTLAHPPTLTYYGGEVPPAGTAVGVETTDGDILWDDLTNILWDDSTNIEWSHNIDTSPDRSYSFSVPRITYSGEVPPAGTAVGVETTDGDILWDDLTNILWDDSTNIEWSHNIDTSPDRSYSFSVPRITYSGEAE